MANIIKFNNANLNSDMISLPIGYRGGDGTLYNMVEIVAMDGNDEELIMDKKVASNGANVVTTLLANKIVSLSNDEGKELDRVSFNMVKGMFTGDRDMILMAIRKLSLGNIMTINAQCPRCGEKYEVDIDIDEDVVVNVWDPEENELHRSKHGAGFVDFELPDGVYDGETVHKKGWLKLPDGYIEEQLAPMVNQNPGKANTALITACIQQLGDLPMIDSKMVRSMTRKDREYITSLIKDANVGPQFRVGVSCPYCGNDFKVMLELPNFFMGRSEV